MADFPFARGLILARADAGPAGQVPGRGEAAHVGAGLGRAALNPGDGAQQRYGRLGKGGDVGLQVLDVGKHALKQEGVVLLKAAGKRPAQGGQLGAQAAPGQLGQGLGVGLAVDKCPHHGPPGDPHNIGGHVRRA